MLNTIKSLNLSKYYDNTGYNVLEIPSSDYVNNKEVAKAVLSFLSKYPNLYVNIVDEYGNINGDIKGTNLTCVIYDPKEWVINGIE